MKVHLRQIRDEGLHLEGEEDEVRQLIERLGEGPPSAEVSKVDVEEVEPEDFHHFAVARSF